MQNETQFLLLGKLDKVGILCSGLCAIHCLLIPVIALSSPLLANFFQNEWIHMALLLIILPMALISFTKSHKIHGNPKPFVFGCFGIILLFTAFFLEGLQIEIPRLDEYLTSLGSLTLILGHILNINALKCCSLPKNTQSYNKN